MGLYRPFTIIFWVRKAADAQTLVQDNSQEYVYQVAHEWANIQYAFIVFILTKRGFTKIEKKRHFLSGKKCLAKIALFFAF